METLLELLKTYGLPTTLLLALCWYHVSVVKEFNSRLKELAKEKDGEISRLNAQFLEHFLRLTKEFNGLQNESNKTLGLIAERLDR